jgi:4-hydroxy-4-methyl-2-oxoglutarate aldolase
MTVEILNGDVIGRFSELPTGWITDALERLGLAGWSQGVYPVSQTERRVAGRAVTIQYLPKRGGGPKLPSHYDVIENVAQPGDVLVIAAGGTPCWLMGENQAHWAMYHGLAGIVVDGCVRDADEIAELSMPVFARGAGTRPYSTHLEMTGVNVAVEFAGVQIRSGDVIVGDGDGLVVVPGDRAEDVLFQALDIALIEKEMEEAIKRGVTVKELAKVSSQKKVRKER